MENSTNSPAPNELDFDILWPEALEDQWKFLTRLQDFEPIFWSDHQKAWIVTRYEDVRAAHMDTKRLSSERMEIYLRDFSDEHKSKYPTAIKIASGLFSYKDGEAHLRQRGLVMKAFGRASVEVMRSITKEISDELLDLCETKGDFDFMEVVAYQLPSRVVMRILGLPDKYRDRCFRMAVALGRALGAPRPLPGVWDEFEESLVDFLQILDETIDAAEESPREGLLSQLVRARDGEQRLSHDELLSAVVALVSAGFDTTGCGLGAFLDWISTRQDLQTLVRESPKSSLDVVHELLRYPGIIRSQTRIVSEDFEWHGKTLRKGEFVYMMHAAANVDPRAFSKPFELDASRPYGDAVPFGYGIHHCVGHILARMELSEFLPQAFSRFDIEVLLQKRDFVPMYAFYCYRTLPVRFRRRD